MNTLISGTDLPDLYYADVPVHDEKQNKTMNVLLPFLLVHEMLTWLLEKGRDKLSRVCCFQGKAKQSKHERVCSSCGILSSITAALGLHGDGVPFLNAQSVEVYSWNFVSLPQAERVLFCCLEKRYLCRCGCGGRHTLNALMRVFVWNMKVLCLSVNPSSRHDGSEWSPSDKNRKKKGGVKLGFRVCWEQLRGDWAFFKQLFGTQGWASKSICWRCEANRSTHPFWDFKASAAWRKTKRNTAMFMKEMYKNTGDLLCVLFQCPGWSIDIIAIDVLHTCDLGTSQDALENLFYEALDNKIVCPGRSKDDRLQSLWMKIKEYYRKYTPTTRISNLTMGMVKASHKKAPRFRAKGTETRHLIAFGVILAQELFDATRDKHSSQVLHCMKSLFQF